MDWVEPPSVRNDWFLTILTDKLAQTTCFPVLTVFLARLYSMLRSVGLERGQACDSGTSQIL